MKFHEKMMEDVARVMAVEIDKEILASLSEPGSLKKYEKYFPKIYTKENKI